MKLTKRELLKMTLGLPALLLGKHAAAGEKVDSRKPSILIQESPLAGFQYHEGERVWSRLRVGQPLELRREPDNPYDSRAVKIVWRNRKLGYLPKAENMAVAQMMDRDVRLHARITGLAQSRNPWKRVTMEVWM